MQRAQDEALQAYVDEAGRLMLEKKLSDPKVKTILRARTITVLGRLDPSGGGLAPSGKIVLMQFLVEAELIQSVEGDPPIISLRGADLRQVFLYDAADNLSDADLSDAHLTDASGITNEELEQQAESLEGATMPDGQKYEDWLKDKKKRGGD